MNQRKQRKIEIVFFLCLVIIFFLVAFGNGRSLQAGDITPTVENFLPLVSNPQESTATVPAATETAMPTTVATVIATPTNTPPSSPPTGCSICSYNAYNCDDFHFQVEAQACHDYCFMLVGFDVHMLDGDDDGLACEHLP